MSLILNSVILLPLLFCEITAAQQATTPKPESHDTDINRQATFFQNAINGAVFIYIGNPNVHPCEEPNPGTTLLPLGSGFVVGIDQKGASDDGKKWHGWKYLVTARHVVNGQTSITLRVNSIRDSKYLCKTVDISSTGPDANLAFPPDGVDLAAIQMPEIEGSDPTVLTAPLLIDESQMKSFQIGVGTQVSTIGYLYGFSGLKENYPVAKFGHISLLTDELWYRNPESGFMERGYVLDLSNAPGLSGAPVYTYGTEFESSPLRYRELPPYLVGVVKGLMLVPVNGQLISQGIAVIEPGENVKALMRQLANTIKAGGGSVVEIN